MNLKDYIHYYLGQKCLIGDDKTFHYVRMVNETGLSVCTGTNLAGVPVWYKSSSCKLILRPLSEMTEEEENQVAALCVGNEDFIITYRGMGYFEGDHKYHESVKCLKVETFSEHPEIKNWIPSNLIQIDYEDEFMPIIKGNFSDMGKECKDDLIEKPFELTRYLLSHGFDIFNLHSAGLCVWEGKE